MSEPSQHWNADRYARNARFVANLATPVMDLLAPRAGERILDLGCGDGVLTRELADLGCRVIGADASPELVDAARALGLDVRVIDGQALAFENDFDAVFSNAALHWMPDARAVLTGVAHALVPGGRFVAEMGGHGNCATIVRALERGLEQRGVDAAAHNPWYFPTPEAYAQALEQAGFDVASMQLEPRPTELPGDVLGWLETFAGSFVSALPPKQQAAYLDEVASTLESQLKRADGVWVADYVRLRFKAVQQGR